MADRGGTLKSLLFIPRKNKNPHQPYQSGALGSEENSALVAGWMSVAELYRENYYIGSSQKRRNMIVCWEKNGKVADKKTNTSKGEKKYKLVNERERRKPPDVKSIEGGFEKRKSF